MAVISFNGFDDILMEKWKYTRVLYDYYRAVQVYTVHCKCTVYDIYWFLSY